MNCQRTLWMCAALALALSTGCASQVCSTGSCGSPLGLGKHSVAAPCHDCGGVGCGKCGPSLRQRIRDKLTCGSGCGDLVLDEWFDNPPDCCDPCDNWGGYSGKHTCPPKPFGLCNLWGVRVEGCSSCGVAPGLLSKSSPVIVHEGNEVHRAEAPGASGDAGEHATEDAGPAEGAAPNSNPPMDNVPAGDPMSQPGVGGAGDAAPELRPRQTPPPNVTRARRGVLFH